MILDVVIEGDRLRTDEAALKVGVNNAGRFRGGIALMNRPGACFLFTAREEGLQTEQVVSRADHAVEARLFHSHIGEEHGAVFFRHFEQFNFGLGRNRDNCRALFLGDLTHGIEIRVVLKAVFAHIGNKHHGLQSKETVILDQQLLFVSQRHRAGGLAFIQDGLKLFQHSNQLSGFFVSTLLGLLAPLLDLLLNDGEVRESQFRIDDFNVGRRIHFAGHVNNVVVLKAADDVGNGVALTDVGEELIAQAFALARAGNQTGDVDEFDSSRNDFLGVVDFGERLQTRIRNLDDAHIGINCAEGVILSGDARFRQSIEKR